MIANSQYTRALLGELHGRWAFEKTKVIPGWVDLNRFQVVADRQPLKESLGWPQDIPVFFTLRRLVPRTGIDLLLHAFREVRDRGLKFHLVIGGDGPLRGRLEDLRKKLGLSDEVRFLGSLNENALPSMYAACDAFVLPSSELECFGLIILEALACGRPVLATPVGAIPEVLERFERGWLAEEVSSEAFARHLVLFLKGSLPAHNPWDLRAKVAEHYSRERVLEHLVSEVMGSRDEVQA